MCDVCYIIYENKNKNKNKIDIIYTAIVLKLYLYSYIIMDDIHIREYVFGADVVDDSDDPIHPEPRIKRRGRRAKDPHPHPHPDTLTIADRDTLLSLIQEKLKYLGNQRIHQKKTLEHRVRENATLQSILEDYDKKHKSIIKMKKMQQQQIYSILDYLEKSLEDVGVSQTKLEEAKTERKRLLREIDIIQSDIDAILE